MLQNLCERKKLDNLAMQFLKTWETQLNRLIQLGRRCGNAIGHAAELVSTAKGLQGLVGHLLTYSQGLE
eukprot:2737175-Amphidinium_carterae.1